MRLHWLRLAILSGTALAAAPAWAQPTNVEALSAELAAARQEIAEQRRMIDAQEARLRALEGRLALASPAPASGAAVATASAQPAGIEQVGEAPPELEMPQVAVLGDQGNIITRAGQLTAEAQLEYARADRNRALFRGIEVVESVLIGVFDINESRQDVLTAAASLRYGVTSRFEVGVRLPYIYRSDTSILAPIAGTSGDPDATIDSSARGNGIGDVELSARYQLTSARRGLPFLIANLQVVAPTGDSPFTIPRDDLGRGLRAATGAGFWGVTGSMTAILPTDPAVLFGTLGYTHNFGSDVNTRIPPVLIERVDPGEALSASVGIGVALNPRTSFNLGYSHSWVFGTSTLTRLIEPGPEGDLPSTTVSRDLQLGRLLFGVTYRLSDTASINWSVEVGATDDATDLRTVLRIPIILSRGR